MDEEAHARILHELKNGDQALIHSHGTTKINGDSAEGFLLHACHQVEKAPAREVRCRKRAHGRIRRQVLFMSVSE